MIEITLLDTPPWCVSLYPTLHQESRSGSFAHTLRPDGSCSSERVFATPYGIVSDIWLALRKQNVPLQFQTGSNSTMKEKYSTCQKTSQVQRAFGTFCLNKALINEQSFLHLEGLFPRID